MISTEFEMDITPVTVGIAGEMQEASKVILKAPGGQNRRDAITLKNAVTKAMFHAQDLFKSKIEDAKEEPAKPKEDETEEGGGDALLMTLYASDADIDNLYVSFSKMLANGCGSIVGENREGNLDVEIFDKIYFEDQERMLGEYLNHFLPISRNEKNGKS